jgi:hypothetical protein
MKTKEEIEYLKKNWLSDPCYDLYNVEGFEYHREELKEFQEKQEQLSSEIYNEKLLAKADEIGCPGNKVLASYILGLEIQIDKLESRLERAEEVAWNNSRI